jgi:hypothetical protein
MMQCPPGVAYCMVVRDDGNAHGAARHHSVPPASRNRTRHREPEAANRAAAPAPIGVREIGFPHRFVDLESSVGIARCEDCTKSSLCHTDCVRRRLAPRPAGPAGLLRTMPSGSPAGPNRRIRSGTRATPASVAMSPLHRGDVPRGGRRVRLSLSVLRRISLPGTDEGEFRTVAPARSVSRPAARAAEAYPVLTAPSLGPPPSLVVPFRRGRGSFTRHPHGPFTRSQPAL